MVTNIDSKLMQIEAKVSNIINLRQELNEVERQLQEDLINLDKAAFNGLTWYEYLKTIDETIQVSDTITIQRQSYRIIGTLNLPNNVVITISDTIYKNNTIKSYTIHYKDTDRYVTGSIPKKYEDQVATLEQEIAKHKVERPSDKYAKQAHLTAF